VAIYHLHVQTIGRGSGKSAIAAAAYRSTSRLTDNETGIICDYTRKAKAVHSGIIAPLDAPDWVYNREKLWNEVQTKEDRKNSQFAWEYDIALPNEVKNWRMINRFCQDNFVKKGLICDYAIHKPDKQGDNRNWHAHIMVTTRKMTAEGWGEKYRHGENKMNDRREWLNEVRKSWEDICNEHLQRIGSKERVDCRTLEAQGIDRVPQQHQGPTATAIERNGFQSARRTRRPDSFIIDGDLGKTEKEEDISDALKAIANEEKLLNEKIRLANLSEDDFKKEYKVLEYGQTKAQALATSELLPEIEKANSLEAKDNNKRLQELKKQKPNGIYQKPNALKNFFMEWHSDDGKIFKKYDDYAEHQQELINKFLAKVTPHLEEQKALAAEKKLIEEAKSDKTNQGLEATNRILKLGREQEKRPTLFDKIKEKAQELLDKASEFSGYRNFKNALEEVREARAETARQRRQETTQTRGMKR